MKNQAIITRHLALKNEFPKGFTGKTRTFFLPCNKVATVTKQFNETSLVSTNDT